jgi:hypothetical protein|tara:strand:- start:826 stop:1233 length:408 start_codon:yes stop_codon:yes gene_type:complete
MGGGENDAAFGGEYRPGMSPARENGFIPGGDGGRLPLPSFAPAPEGCCCIPGRIPGMGWNPGIRPAACEPPAAYPGIIATATESVEAGARGRSEAMRRATRRFEGEGVRKKFGRRVASRPVWSRRVVINSYTRVP